MTHEQIAEQRERLTQNYQRYMAALDAVEELIDAQPTAARVVIIPAVEPKTTKAKPAKPVKVAKPAKTNGRPTTGADTETVVAAAAKLPDPFHVADLAKALCLDKKAATNCIWRCILNKSLVKGPERGTYRLASRSNGNGHAKPVPAAAKRVFIPGLDTPSLEQQIKHAVAELADAKAKGQDTLAGILEHKVQNLQARLSAGEQG